MSNYILAIDQGTTSSRAIIYDKSMHAIAHAQQEVDLYFPQPGFVEQKADEIWQSVHSSIKQVLKCANLHATDIAAIGISNQRETTLLWHRHTGEVLHNAIVWQDRRTADFCQQLKINHKDALLKRKTGLLADPYFSATKLRWLLEHLPNARSLAEQGELCFGTIDTFLLWQLSGKKVHATDATNASRTMLFNIHTQQWDDELLRLFSIPKSVLPSVLDSAAQFGVTEKNIFGHEIPLTAVLGDQQSALLGQACIKPGMSKSTYGTGCFAVVNTGQTVINSEHKLLSTIAWRINGQCTYALEGSIFMAGATVQWLRDRLGIINQASDTEALACGISYSQTELLIPAFTGLGTPHWRPEVKAALFGMTRDSGRAQIAAAALCSVAYQTQDLLSAFAKDGISVNKLRVDGGMTANHWFLQALADVTQIPLERCDTSDATAFGVAFLAALQQGWFEHISDITTIWHSDRQFEPIIDTELANALYRRWEKATDVLKLLDLQL